MVPPPTAFKIDADARAAGARQVPERSRRRLHRLPQQARLDEVLGPGRSEHASAPAVTTFNLGPAGVLYAKNITPAAIGSWTDGELLRAVTQGVSKDGTPLFPLMPYPHFGALDEEDIHAVLAYVRSFKAIESTPKPRQLNFPLNLIVRTIPAAQHLHQAAVAGRQAGLRQVHDQGRALHRLPHADRRAGHAVAGNGVRGRHGVPRNGLPRAVGEHHARRQHRHRVVDRAAVHRQVQGLRESDQRRRWPSTSARRTRRCRSPRTRA